MSDSTDKNSSDIAFIRNVAHIEWGFEDEAGNFVVLPKLPLVRSGFREPPFDVMLPNGEMRHIIAREIVTTEDPETVTRPPLQVGPPERREPVPAPKLKAKHRVRVYTASKLRHAPFIRDEISKWPEVEVTSRWPFSHVDGDQPLWPEDSPPHGSIFWQWDEADVRKADLVLLFGDENDVLRGGLVEAGMGLALGKKVIVVGHNDSYGTWQFHPNVYRVRDLAEARSLLSLIGADMLEAAHVG